MAREKLVTGFPGLEPGQHVRISLAKYHNGAPVILGTVEETGEAYAVFSVNIEEHASKLPPNHTFIKTYSEGEGMLELLQRNGIVGKVKYEVSNGFVTVPAVEITLTDPDDEAKQEAIMDQNTDEMVRAALDDPDAVSYMGAIKLLRRMAMMLKDGEQTEERVKEGLDEFVLENDDAVDTLHELITEARELTAEKPHGLVEEDDDDGKSVRSG